MSSEAPTNDPFDDRGHGAHRAYKPRILVADDEESMRFVLRDAMEREEYNVQCASNGEEVVNLVRQEEFDLLVMDVKMPKVDGLQALHEVKRLRPDMIVVMVTAHGTNQVALDAVRQGAYDYFTKPFELDEMRIVVRRALEKQSLLRQINNLETRLRDRLSHGRIIGNSNPMRRVYDIIAKVVTNDVTVLITGASGTGKELVAQDIHYNSRRRSRPFVSVNCAAIPESLLESELFGHEKGAFTGAIATKAGQFEQANTGTIFLDEIGDMPLALQSKVLRALQEREIVRVGGARPIKIDIRIVAATNQNLGQLVERKSFREDLYFRLNVVTIELPLLWERKDDIPLLASHFLSVYNPRLNKNIGSISRAAMDALEAYPWPGNVRELENVIQRAMILATGQTIEKEDLPASVTSGLPEIPRMVPVRESAVRLDDGLIDDFSIPLQQKIERLSDELEQKIIRAALQKANFHRQGTADLLGISRKSLHNKMVKYKLFGEVDEDYTTDS